MDYLTRGFVSKETLVLHQWRIIDSLTNESTKFFNSIFCCYCWCLVAILKVCRDSPKTKSWLLVAYNYSSGLFDL